MSQRTEYFEIVKESLLSVFMLAKALEESEKNYFKVLYVFFYWRRFKKNLAKTRSVLWYWSRMTEQERFFIYLWASSEQNTELAIAKKTVNTAMQVWESGKSLYRYIKYK